MALMQMNTGIYKITCIPTGRIYIGSSVNIKKRWREHVRMLGSGNHHSRFMQRSWSKHGAESFSFEKLIVCDKKDLLFYEQRAIDAMSPDYNSAPVAGSQLGYRHTPETRAKMRISRPKDFSPFTGRNHTPETIKKISMARKGKGGGKRPPEWVASLSAAQKGRPKSKEHKEKISQALIGHKQSSEQIEKRMNKIRGRAMPDGFAEAQSKRRTGMKFAPDHCLNIGKSKAKLTDDQAREIRRRIESGERQRSIASDYGVDPSVISTIKTKSAYAWVK